MEITVRADAFCHSMVRSLVGALVAVADRAAATLGWLSGLTARPRGSVGAGAAGPGGLTLEEVGYPADDEPGGPGERGARPAGAGDRTEPVRSDPQPGGEQ